MSKKLSYWGNDRGIKRKASVLSLIALIVGGGVVIAGPLSTSTAMAQQTTITASASATATSATGKSSKSGSKVQS